MPTLENPRHEAFAQALARGSSATAAYIEESAQRRYISTQAIHFNPCG